MMRMKGVGAFTWAVGFGIVLLFFLFAFGIGGTSLNVLTSLIGNNANPLGFFAQAYSGSFGALAIVGAVVGVGSIIFGTFVFPNPYLIFGGFFAIVIPIAYAFFNNVLSAISGVFDPLIYNMILTIVTVGLIIYVMIQFKSGADL